MQKLMGLVRRCADDYRMIEAGDRIAVGVSGGKDSLTLLVLLAGLRKFYPYRFDLQAVTIDMGLDGMDFSGVRGPVRPPARCRIPEWRPRLAPSFLITARRKIPAPCVPKMRRGALNEALLEQGCTQGGAGAPL